MADILLTIGAAAKILGGVSVRTLEREHADGRLAIIRVRSRRFVELGEINRYIAAQRCQSASTATGGKSASAWEVADALSAAFRSAPPVSTRKRSKLASAARRSRLQLVE